MCVKNGVPLAIVEAAGKVYIPAAAGHKNQNAKLMQLSGLSQRERHLQRFSGTDSRRCQYRTSRQTAG